ncbi:efflux RND transporter periplasmic adaptor subunit [Novosphingobium sp. TH158]|uniref:efflux RND transporter periplasmic adaptor subunit n=1 Tax=Novosphingobium sp. TH158 TaxID=2067455 RepID=UPI000C7E2D04|nr:efflux RND transporter periplasmic adaptor subunit [Novosphingobium sp. TH158]PLK27140.1 efflux RND transporter periplasmic adaptor subunit [Novosphingobium sp. TH158]
MNYESSIDSAVDGQELAGGPLDAVEEEDRRSRKRTILIIAGAVVLLIALFFVLHGFGGQEAEKKDQAPRVSVVAPGAVTVEGMINVNGSLAARREMPVGSVGEGGQVRQVLVEAGDWVRAGQVLAVIDRSVQVQQQAGSGAQIAVAEADARLAQANLDRALKLVDRGFISKADVDRLTATRDAANARVRVARASFAQIGAQIARLNIVAPAAGLVLERRIEPGQVVGGGSGVLFRIAKDGEMELKAQVGEMDLAKVTAGVSAEVTPVGGARKFTGQVWQVSPVIDPQTRQGFARIALAYAPELRPGGFASAVIKAGTMVAPMLPDSAILSDGQTSYVYIVGKGNKVERRNVKLGLVTDKGIAIASGLSGSEKVVLRAGGFLSPGETIQPVAGKP